MDFWQTIILAILQGLTEFLPISSSAHLILLPKVAGWADQGIAFDIAVHVGTLAAVMIYFRKDVIVLTRDWSRSLIHQQHTQNSRLAWGVIIGTIPVGLSGLIFNDVISTTLRSATVIAITTIIFGIVLGIADRYGRHTRDEHTLEIKDILIIGLAQAIALIPGTSRSGITITAALALGLTRQGAARFSFLLSIPVIALAGIHKSMSLVNNEQMIDWSILFFAALISCISAHLCIRVFLSIIERIGLMPFVIYRILLGILIFALQ